MAGVPRPGVPVSYTSTSSILVHAGHMLVLHERRHVVNALHLLRVGLRSPAPIVLLGHIEQSKRDDLILVANVAGVIHALKARRLDVARAPCPTELIPGPRLEPAGGETWLCGTGSAQVTGGHPGPDRRQQSECQPWAVECWRSCEAAVLEDWPLADASASRRPHSGRMARTLTDSSFSHIVDAPIERIDIADWLFHLRSSEYQRCCPSAHIAAGLSTSDDGRPMVINVEMIGDSLMIQKYVAEVTHPNHCRMISTSDVFTPLGRTTSHVMWDLSVQPLDEQSCEYINQIKRTATDEFLVFIDENDITLDQATAAQREASAAHNEMETPRYAASIERRALMGLSTRSVGG
jgi:hypothetical protein